MTILAAYCLDLFLGDPAWLPHPVKAIGRLIQYGEKWLWAKETVWRQRAKGALLAVLVVTAAAGAGYFFLESATAVNARLGVIAGIFLSYTTLASGDLYLHVRRIYRPLVGGDLTAARTALGLIVGRDTGALSREAVIIAASESTAESTCDGIVAPLFYLFLGGPALALGYKAVNTLDSMIGHKDERYLHFGWFAARLDDIANFIPARISGLLLALAALINGKGIAAFKVMVRQGRQHPSPNSGVPEAAMAGALGVRFGGPRAYAGKTIVYPYIGQALKQPQPGMLKDAMGLSLLASLLTVAAGLLTKHFLGGL